ncbi:MAG: ATP-binding cassette domain-containing protein [Candidatus ainarchaeum sp.]|nr:ATP-binding cassette domain-containing protein [Candidatus ainarchaeum sp.]
MNNCIIETKALTKKFNSLIAVNNVSIKVNKGEIFGILGPNGAGKTTLISMLITMKKPSSGEAVVDGFDIRKNPDDVRKSIGIVFQDPSLDEELTAFENLEMHAALYGITKKEREKRIKEVIHVVELDERLTDLVKTYSGGMRRRLEIARGLIHRPKILFLDEPTLGLDPQTRKRIWDYIRKLKKENNTTIILTTHYMDEADSLCDRIAIIDHGNIIILDNNENLKNSIGGDVISIKIAEPKKLREKIENAQLKWIKGMEEYNDELKIRVEMGERRIPKIIEIAKNNNWEIESVNLHKPTLDDVFFHYTGKDIREENGSVKDLIRIRRKAWGKGR